MHKSLQERYNLATKESQNLNESLKYSKEKANELGYSMNYFQMLEDMYDK